MIKQFDAEMSSHAWSEYTQREQTLFPHHTITQHTQHNEPKEDEEANYTLSSTYHLPFLPPKPYESIRIDVRDPAASLVHDKVEWSKQVDFLVKKYRQNYVDAVVSVQKEYSISSKETLMPHRSARFFKLMDKDPDSEFSGVTNWFYTGGRLSRIAIGNQTFLATCCGKKTQDLQIIPLKEVPKLGWQPILEASSRAKLSLDNTIFQILGKSKNSTGLIGVRQRNLCTIYGLMPETGSIKLSGYHQATSDKPFTSLDLSMQCFAQYCTSSTNRQITLWDAITCKCIASEIVKRPKYEVSNPWCCAQFSDAHNIVMSDSTSLCWLDTRISLKIPTKTLYPREISSLISTCEDICLQFPSLCSENIYLATTHHLLHLDSRNDGIFQRWTHLLRTPPIYSHSLKFNNTDFICIANQEPAEVELIINTFSNNSSHSSTLPFMLPLLQESLHAGKMHGQFLDPVMQQRMKSSLTGVLSLPIKNGNDCQILSQTAYGDIFIQDFNTKGMETLKYNKQDLDILQSWEQKSLEGRCPTKLKITNKISCMQVIDHIKNPMQTTNPYKADEYIPESLKISKRELLSCVDMLAPKLLSIWDLDDEPEWGTDYGVNNLEIRSEMTQPTIISGSHTIDSSSSSDSDEMDAINALEETPNSHKVSTVWAPPIRETTILSTVDTTENIAHTKLGPSCVSPPEREYCSFSRNINLDESREDDESMELSTVQSSQNSILRISAVNLKKKPNTPGF